MMTDTYADQTDCLLPLFASSPTSAMAVPPPPYTRHTHQTLQDGPIALEWNGTLGDVTLESIDGGRFLVHRELLEKECSFFYIYYATHPPPSPTMSSSNSSLFCLGRWFIASNSNARRSNSPCFPPLPPKSLPVKSPQPLSLNQWLVPETESVLFTFLSLIYSLKEFPTPEQMGNFELLREVLRTALGYQSERATCKVKRALTELAPTQPIQVYALASRYRMHDIAVIASRYSLQVPETEWPEHLLGLMGNRALAALEKLRDDRFEALRSLLSPTTLLSDDHSIACVHTQAVQAQWNAKVASMSEKLTAGSTLEDLITMKWKEVTGCESCTMLLQDTLVDVLSKERQLKDTI